MFLIFTLFNDFFATIRHFCLVISPPYNVLLAVGWLENTVIIFRICDGDLRTPEDIGQDIYIFFFLA